MELSPLGDGVDHINIYSRARTPLGKWLSNFTTVNVRTRHGVMSNVEAYWYWLSTGRQCEELRTLGGPAAKTLGKTLSRVEYADFDLCIREALTNKVVLGDHYQEFMDSALPLEHYYWYGEPDNCKTVVSRDALSLPWLRHLRDVLQRPQLRVCVLGSRDIKPRHEVLERLYRRLGTERLTVVSGMAKGPDTEGMTVAEAMGIPVDRHPADWDGLGKRAGMVRNAEMAKVTDLAVVFWDGKSRGTTHMLSELQRLQVPYVLLVTNPLPS